MLSKLLIIFTLVPLVELWLLFEVSKYIGGGTTVIIVAMTGFFGVILAKSQGLMVLRQMAVRLSKAEMPAAGLIDGACILIGGAFLLTPGLLTDAAGFMLLFPITRGIIKKYARTKIQQMIESNDIFIYRK
ncbi:FxsA family protein [Alkalicella caledoniensis]|uniref:FxsA family protein n=1 Tax=Alkalicella caledoniensis TaxID=2731377 RepID=A0A7G9WAE3_ALKCA|nr:FxsA family protein [Alkalicella caledoniensis]QNO15655.1 FxsA family protein [Alkalicella caledoniensis]